MVSNLILTHYLISDLILTKIFPTNNCRPRVSLYLIDRFHGNQLFFSPMLQVTVPDGVVEGGQFQGNTPNGPVLITVPPGVKSGQVRSDQRTGADGHGANRALSDASNAMVGTWTLVPSGSIGLLLLTQLLWRSFG